MSVFVYFTLLFSAGVLGKSGLQEDDGSLNLTPLVEKGELELARNLSTVDPSLFAGVHSHAAYFTVNRTAKWNLFFWFFPAEGLPLESTPWLIWLQGGPGGSSLYGLFTEIGPLRIVDGKVDKMPITWGSDYSLLFIDNPVGTGFSYTETEEYVSNEDMVGGCLLSLLQQFLDVFPELRKAPLFVSGESYAGKYIPAVGHYIHHNKNDSKPINLRGLAIGDGWTDPPTLLHYSEWALQVGLVDPEQANMIYQEEQAARKYWDAHNYPDYEKAAKTAYDLLKTYAPVDNYNYLRDETNLTGAFVDFLNKPEIQTALHVNKMKYIEINGIVWYSLQHDFYDTAKPWLEKLLEHYGVMCYSGQLDVIVAYALSVHTYRSLNWTGQDAYLKAPRVTFRNKRYRPVGFVMASGNFMDVMIRNAGHMVPADQPEAAKLMIDMFIDKFK